MVVPRCFGNRTRSAHSSESKGELPRIAAVVVAYAIAGTVLKDLIPSRSERIRMARKSGWAMWAEPDEIMR